MGALAVLAGEAVAVEQGHEQLEVLGLAVVGGGGHQQEVAGHLLQAAAEPVAPGLSHLCAVVGGRHLVGLVHHHQIPLGAAEPGDQIVVSGQHVEPGDQPGPLGHRVAGARRLHHVPGEQIELEAELLAQLVLPLLHQAAGGHHQAAVEIAPHLQLLDEQAGHDGLARAGIVGQQEPQRAAGQHLVVDGLDLVGEGVDVAGLGGQVGVEKVGEPDAHGLGGQHEQGRVGVERPGPPALGDLQPVLAGPVDQLPVHVAALVLVGEVDRPRPDPLGVDHRHHPRRRDPPNPRPLSKLLQPRRHSILVLARCSQLAPSPATNLGDDRSVLGVRRMSLRPRWAENRCEARSL